MTNGEMIQKIFNCEVCEPIIEEDIIHVIFPDKNDSAIGFDWSWWNMEHNEPTTPNDCETCIHNKGVLECDMYGCKYEPTTKNDLGVDLISREQAIEEADKLCLETGYDNEKVIEMLNELPTVTPQEPKPMVEIDLDYVIKQKYIEREVLDKIRAEIETKYGQCDICEYDSDYCGWNQVGDIADILQIIDKYKAETEDT